ncbi:hypothetical protein FRC04_012015 [Tulasnella sp. 424]|nr:hypothetical protein FRC04_012015 [Tulasnella sp. 424]KAG8971256.1 hypothetical protein FRC05_011355 [Tulasnella sp. 425]
MTSFPTTSDGKEYVGLSTIVIGTGAGGTIPMLARVTLVNWYGQPLYDTYVKPTDPVTSYRETTTGLDGTYFTDEIAVPFQQAQLMVAGWLSGKVIVGHQIWKDLQVLNTQYKILAT